MSDNETEREDQPEDDRSTLADAIAQHLELKRQHGAPEADVDSERDAALGPARSDAQSAAMSTPTPAPEPAAPVEPEPTPPSPAEPASGDASSAMAADSVEFDFGAERRSIVEDLPPESGIAPPAPPPVVEPAQSKPPPPSSPARTAEPTPATPVKPAAGDVLEQTPEFFEETPEYDRLWFEEKAPRDFDF